MARNEREYILPEETGYLIEVIKHARDELDHVQEAMLRDSQIGVTAPQFSKWINGRAPLRPELEARLRAFARTSLAESYRAVTRHHDPQFRAENRMAEMAALYPALHKSFSTHLSQMQRLRDQGIDSYYYVYKYSYSEHKKIVKSVARIRDGYDHRAKPLVFEEKQISGRQREDSAGIVFSKSDAVWIMAQEIVAEQPRFMVLAGLLIGFRHP